MAHSLNSCSQNKALTCHFAQHFRRFKIICRKDRQHLAGPWFKKCLYLTSKESPKFHCGKQCILICPHFPNPNICCPILPHSTQSLINLFHFLKTARCEQAAVLYHLAAWNVTYLFSLTKTDNDTSDQALYPRSKYLQKTVLRFGTWKELIPTSPLKQLRWPFLTRNMAQEAMNWTDIRLISSHGGGN